MLELATSNDINFWAVGAILGLILLMVEKILAYISKRQKLDVLDSIETQKIIARAETLRMLKQITNDIRLLKETAYHNKRKIDDLHVWHDVKDIDGGFIWYVKSSLENAIIKLADNVETQTIMLRDMLVLFGRDKE